nr:F-box domain-containing protein [Cedratvirus duvanny]
MQELPDEVALMILEKVPIEDLSSFCSTNKQYQNLCFDKHLWYRIFEREGLTLLEEGNDLPSWMAIYYNSLLSKEKADYVFSLYEEKRRPFLSMFKPIPLYKIRHVELLGEQEDASLLSSLISVDTYREQIKKTRELTQALLNRNLPDVNFNKVYVSKPPKQRNFVISKRDDEFIFLVGGELLLEPEIERSISKEETKDILYRLSYYNLLELHESIFSTYERETNTNRRYKPLMTRLPRF